MSEVILSRHMYRKLDELAACLSKHQLGAVISYLKTKMELKKR